MSLKPGQTVIGDDTTVTYEAGETISPGDVVGIDGGQLRAANSGDGSPNPIGVAGHGGGESAGEDYASGEDVPVVVDAVCVLTSVADGVTAGTELGASATDGELAAGSGGFEPLTDEGAAAGLSTNETIPAGYAGTKLP